MLFYKELKPILISLKKSYEIIFVDDGSLDRSFEILKNLAKNDKNARLIKLKSNYGQTIALSAGIESSKGNFIVTIDSDLQHDPATIPKMLDLLEKGYDVVVARRIWKKRGLGKAFSSGFCNYLTRKIGGVKLKDSVSGFKAFKREVAENIPIYGNMHRYFAVLAIWKGFRVTDIPTIVRPRKLGISHYGISRLFLGFLDLLTIKFFISYSQKPSHLFGTAGFFTLLFGLLISLWLSMQKIFFNISIGSRLPLFVLGILLIILGVFFWFFGLLADMISYQAISAGKQKTYIIEKTVN
jgi:glycosyltransferase involved in cell wall biosynthesis